MSPTKRNGSVIVFDTKPCQHRNSSTWVRLSSFFPSQTNRRFPGEPVIEQPTPKWQSHVLIYADTHKTDPEPERRLVAALNLDKLGWTTNFKRLFGRRSQIYVMELPHQGSAFLIWYSRPWIIERAMILHMSIVEGKLFMYKDRSKIRLLEGIIEKEVTEFYFPKYIPRDRRKHAETETVKCGGSVLRIQESVHNLQASDERPTVLGKAPILCSDELPIPLMLRWVE